MRGPAPHPSHRLLAFELYDDVSFRSMRYRIDGLAA
jgi:hypothetical protein